MLKHEGPVYLRLSRQKLHEVHKPDYRFELGKADLVWQPEPAPKHFQATIFASGGTVGAAIAAAKDLLPRGFSARVLNVGTIKPFDEEAVRRSAAISERLVSVEDHYISGGLGSAVCEAAAKLGVKIPVAVLGVRDTGESGTPAQLYERNGLNPENIVEACLGTMAP
jgi:transketolase